VQQITIFAVNLETFYYLLGRFRKPQRAQRHAEKNNKPLRLSASSAVNIFCHDPFFQNKLKVTEFGISAYIQARNFENKELIKTEKGKTFHPNYVEITDTCVLERIANRRTESER